jgi:Holliday junction resolvase RusA-like endonuclease
MIGDTLFAHTELINELSRDYPNWERVRNAVLQSYNEENNDTLTNPINSEDEIKIVHWLNTIAFEHPQSPYLFYRRENVLMTLLSSSLTGKIWSLGQYNCPICSRSGLTIDSVFPIHHIRLRISAISGQSSSSRIKKAFSKAIMHRFEGRPCPLFKLGQKLCVHIVFVLGRKAHKKDVDNMAKPLLDALQGTVFENDEDIDHLSIMKIMSNDDENYITLNVRQTYINQHHNVMVLSHHHEWAGAEFLDLQNFME